MTSICFNTLNNMHQSISHYLPSKNTIWRTTISALHTINPLLPTHLELSLKTIEGGVIYLNQGNIPRALAWLAIGSFSAAASACYIANEVIGDSHERIALGQKVVHRAALNHLGLQEDQIVDITCTERAFVGPASYQDCTLFLDEKTRKLALYEITVNHDLSYSRRLVDGPFPVEEVLGKSLDLHKLGLVLSGAATWGRVHTTLTIEQGSFQSKV
jgi:hypothetical protein